MVLEALSHLPAGVVLAAVSIKPDPEALPGMPAATKLVDGLAAFMLVGCAAGFLIGIGKWVFGSRTSNFSQSDSGRGMVFASVAGAFGIGAAAAIINFFLNAGTALK